MAVQHDTAHDTASAALAAARRGPKDSEHVHRGGGTGGNGTVYLADGQGGAVRLEKGPDGQTYSERRIPPL